MNNATSQQTWDNPGACVNFDLNSKKSPEVVKCKETFSTKLEFTMCKSLQTRTVWVAINFEGDWRAYQHDQSFLHAKSSFGLEFWSAEIPESIFFLEFPIQVPSIGPFYTVSDMSQGHLLLCLFFLLSLTLWLFFLYKEWMISFTVTFFLFS